MKADAPLMDATIATIAIVDFIMTDGGSLSSRLTEVGPTVTFVGSRRGLYRS